MSIALSRQSRRKGGIADRRRAALIQAQRRRRSGSSRRSRLREDVSKAPKPLGLYVIAAVTVTLVLLGIVMVLSASSIVSFHKGNSPWKYFLRQVMWAGLGTIAMGVAYRLRLTYLSTIARVLPLIGLAMMLLPFTPGVGRSVNGARAWLVVGPFNVQPAEFMKLFLIIYGADLLTRREKQLADWREGMWPYLKVVMVALLIAVVQSDIGSCVVIGAIGLSVLFLAGAPMRPLIGMSVISGVLGILYVMTDDSKMARFTSFLDIMGTREGDGYQVYQGWISISNGGLTGTGIGAGTGKWGYVPLAHSDFIFSIVAEEMGMLGVLGVLLLFAFLIYFAFQAAINCRDRFGYLLASGIGCWFLVQTAINIGGVLGLMPVTGLTLPFISFGGSSLVVSMTAAGLLMNVARRPK
jgi:cell division protein FtsW